MTKTHSNNPSPRGSPASKDFQRRRVLREPVCSLFPCLPSKESFINIHLRGRVWAGSRPPEQVEVIGSHPPCIKFRLKWGAGVAQGVGLASVLALVLFPGTHRSVMLCSGPGPRARP